MRPSMCSAAAARLAGCLLLTPLLPHPGHGQEGYSLRPSQVEINSRQHWERWQYVAGTVQITDEGVRPAFIRKSTALGVDGIDGVVSGINAVLDAARFGGGVKAAGTNLARAANLMDGRPDTYWEPDATEPIEDWWVQIDLGRTVSATRIVLKFVAEDVGDPFLQFKVTTSQGEVTVGPMLFRTRYTTDRPVKNERVVEIDLTKQLPTKWPNVRGGFTGDVIRYVGVGVTDSDYGRGREVSEAEYAALPRAQQGDIDYFRREASGRLRSLDDKADWDALVGTDRQGPVVYYRSERPRLAEIEVWAIGDNIGTGVLERGGSVTSWENNGAEGSVVDGDFFGQVVYWPAQGGYNPDRLLPSEPPDVERSLFIDLGGAFFLDNIRVLQAATSPPGPFRAYRLQLSDGSASAGGSLVWKTVGALENIVAGESYHDFRFPLTKVKHFAFTYRLFEGAGRHGLSEVQFYGEGYMPESRIESVFGGASPFIELGQTPQNLASIEWDADLPPETGLILETRTGNTVMQVTHYYKKNGEQYPGTEAEAQKAYETDKRFFGESSVGPVITESIPGDDWSGWSQRYLRSGEKITSPSPRKYLAARATFLTADPMAAATLRSVVIHFVRPVARTLVAEVLPSHLEEIGTRQSLTYLLRSTFESDSRGFDEVLIQAPVGVNLEFRQVTVEVTGQAPATYTAESEGLDLVRDESDSLWLRLPSAVKTTSGSALIEVDFDATTFGYNTFLIGAAGHSAFDNSWQRVDDGDANGVTDSETTVVLALERGEVLGDIDVDGGYVTPNGDGVNDEMSVSFSLMRIAAPTPVDVDLFDLSGRRVRRLHGGAIAAGRHTVTWTGLDEAGVPVPPGIYLLRIGIDVDSKSSKATVVHRLVHVAY